MTNEELKQKIVKVLKETINWTTDYSIPIGIVYKSELDEIADALIAAGIGDVSELKKHRVVVEKSLIPEDDNAYVLPNIPPTVKQLYSGEEVEQIVKEREEYKHRAQVAERALQKFAEYITCEDCPFFSDCASSEKMGYPIHSYHCFSEYLKQAEKELAEEKKK